MAEILSREQLRRRTSYLFQGGVLKVHDSYHCCMNLAADRRFLSLLYICAHKKRRCRGSPNIYGNKYGQPEYLWNRWPAVFGIRTSVKLVCA